MARGTRRTSSRVHDFSTCPVMHTWHNCQLQRHEMQSCCTAEMCTLVVQLRRIRDSASLHGLHCTFRSSLHRHIEHKTPPGVDCGCYFWNKLLFVAPSLTRDVQKFLLDYLVANKHTVYTATPFAVTTRQNLKTSYFLGKHLSQADRRPPRIRMTDTTETEKESKPLILNKTTHNPHPTYKHFHLLRTP